VQDNIAAFGGDKTHVMLFGESAGAINTCALLASPLSQGLFTSALMESGNCAAETLTDRYAYGAKLVAQLNCSNAPDVVACLQNAPMASIVNNGGLDYVASIGKEIFSAIDPKQIQQMPFGPTVDGVVLDDVPLATIQAGKHNHVPLAVGTNQKEFDFITDPLAILGCTGITAISKLMFPTLYPKVLALYPCQPNPLASAQQIGQGVTDSFFTCPSRRVARAAASAQTEPVYRYLWTHTTPYLGILGAFGPFHGSEVPYVFGTFAGLFYTPTPAEKALSDQMQRYWRNFAATGDPNGAGQPTWSKYDPTADNAVRLDIPIGTISGFEAAQCDFWDTVE
jgi:para-nitrobenzyl esterase